MPDQWGVQASIGMTGLVSKKKKEKLGLFPARTDKICSI